MARHLSRRELEVKRKFVRVVEELIELGGESVGRIADDVGEHGTDGDGGAFEDSVVLECLRAVVDGMGETHWRRS